MCFAREPRFFFCFNPTVVSHWRLLTFKFISIFTRKIFFTIESNVLLSFIKKTHEKYTRINTIFLWNLILFLCWFWQTMKRTKYFAYRSRQEEYNDSNNCILNMRQMLTIQTNCDFDSNILSRRFLFQLFCSHLCDINFGISWNSISIYHQPNSERFGDIFLFLILKLRRQNEQKKRERKNIHEHEFLCQINN